MAWKYTVMYSAHVSAGPHIVLQPKIFTLYSNQDSF